MSGLLGTRMSGTCARAAGGSPHGAAGTPGAHPLRRSPQCRRQGQHRARAARASRLHPPNLRPPPPSSPPPAALPRAPPDPAPPAPRSITEAPAAPASAPRALPRGHGGAPGLPTLGLGASATSAAPRRLPAPSGAQRLRAPRAGIPAGGSGRGGWGPAVLGPAREGRWAADPCVLRG